MTLPDGREIAASEVLLPKEEPLSYSYCSDTCFDESIIPHIQESTMLYHEATFMDDMQKRAADTKHSTTKQAAKIAQMANVRNLIIGHFSARYKDVEPLLEEAREIFERTELAVEGRLFEFKDYV